MKYLILILSVLFCVVSVFSKREKLALSFIIFLLPFDANPFKSNFFFVGLNGLLIWSFWISYNIRNKLNKRRNAQSHFTIVKYIYYFLFAGIILAIFTDNKGIDIATQADEFSQVVNISLYLITLIFFIKILFIYKDETDYLYKLMYIFITTSFIQLLSIVLPLSGYNNLLPSFLISSSTIYFDTSISKIVFRSLGLISDYEIIIDYVMMVLFFSLILINKGKTLIPIVSIIAAIIIGLLSGTRSFLVILVISFLFYYAYHIVKVNVKQLFLITLLGGIVLIIVNQLFIDQIVRSEIFNRLYFAWSVFAGGEFAESTNRGALFTNYSVFENVNLLGRGSLFFGEMLGNDMVSHNIILAIYAKYGVIGVAFIILLTVKTTVFLYRAFKKAATKEHKSEAILYFLLFLTLFLQSMKVSPLRYLTSILLHSYMYLMVYFFYLKMVHFNSSDVLLKRPNL